MAHTCHAHGCTRSVPPRMFMCRGHWFALSCQMQAAIWREYREGQEDDKEPSLRYMAVQQWAISELVFRPNDEAAALAAAPYVLRSILYRRAAIAAGQGDPLSWEPLPVDPVEENTHD